MTSRIPVLSICLLCLLMTSTGPLWADDDSTVELGKMQVAPKAPTAEQDTSNTTIQRPTIKPGEFSVKAPSAGSIGGFKLAPMQIAKPTTAPPAQGDSSGSNTPVPDAGKDAQATAATTSTSSRSAPQQSAGQVQNIVPIRMDAPDYPREAAIAHKSGSVTVIFTVGTDGLTSNIRIVKSQPRKLFDKAAIRAVMHWRFKPYAVDGKPQARDVEQTIVFDLNKR